MPKQCIHSKNGAPAVGPYSHAVSVGNLLFVSGQGPFARDGSGPIHGTIEEETRQTLENLKVLLEDAGSCLGNVIKTTVFVKDMAQFSTINSIYQEYFTDDPPARSCVEASGLPGGIQVEIEAIALLTP